MNKVVGHRVPRIDGRDKVTGSGQFGADVSLPNMLWGKVLRAKVPHAGILRLNTSRAEKVRGVKGIITSRDLPEGYLGFSIKDQPILARGKVRFIGEAVAAVAAVDLEAAEEALSLIEVEYEELPAVYDPVAAMMDDAPLIHEKVGTYKANFDVVAYGNVCVHTTVRRGNIELGFQEADLVVSERYETQMVHQGYIEPHASLASVDHSGKVTVWSPNQGPFMIRDELANILKLPMSKLRVIATTIGGAFGGKVEPWLEPLCIVLAQKTDRPVKMEMSREEEFICGSPRHPTLTEITVGMKKDGRITAVKSRSIFDTGAYAGFGPLAVARCMLVMGPYKVPHAHIDGFGVYTNKVSCGACRGPGGPQAHFIIESHMDLMAKELGLDPLEIRFKNAVEEGDLSPSGSTLHAVGLREALRVVADEVQWDKKASFFSVDGKKIGRGLACSQWGTGAFASAATIKVNEDGTLSLLTGAVDVGSGANTILAQIVAEILGVPVEDIVVILGDTDVTPYDLCSGSSRLTYSMGLAVKEAAEDVRKKLLALAGGYLEASPLDLDMESRQVFVKGSPDKGMSLAELSRISHKVKGGQVLGSGSVLPVPPPYDLDGVRSHALPSKVGPNYQVQYAEVSVDEETGKVEVLRIVSAHDVGRAINPLGVEGQIQGGAMHGLGFALTENIMFDGPKILNPSFLDYRMFTMADIPSIIPLIVEEPCEDGPFGAKGVGETAAFGTAAAVGNAIFDATGVRITQLPCTPEKLFWELRKNK